jgi:hypothetical protein
MEKKLCKGRWLLGRPSSKRSSSATAAAEGEEEEDWVTCPYMAMSLGFFGVVPGTGLVLASILYLGSLSLF